MGSEDWIPADYAVEIALENDWISAKDVVKWFELKLKRNTGEARHDLATVFTYLAQRFNLKVDEIMVRLIADEVKS